jgi:hypothetical protein
MAFKQGHKKIEGSGMPFGYKHRPESIEKMRLARLGKTSPRKGATQSEETKKKLSDINKWDKHPQWKGDNASIRTIHTWVVKWKGKADHCEKCGTKDAKAYDWSNVDHKYRRVLDDFISMCRSCHKKYDYGVLGMKTKNGKPKNI